MIRPNVPPGDVVVYDFRRPSRISPERQRLLDASHEQLAQAVQAWISARLRAPFTVHLESTGQFGYGDFTAGLPASGAYFVYEVVDRPGLVGLVSLDPSIAFLLIERLLGGSGGTEVPERILTPLERVVVRIVTDRIVRELCSTWQDHVRMELQWSRFESAPELIEMAGRDDDVLVVRLDVGVGETQGAIRIALPFPVLEPFFSRGPVHRLTPTAVSAEEREDERRRVESLVRQASATISARLPSVRVPLRALSELKPGDVLDTGIPATSAVEVLVSGSRRFTAREGRLGPWVGIEIVGPWKPQGHTPRGNRLDVEMRDGE